MKVNRIGLHSNLFRAISIAFLLTLMFFLASCASTSVGYTFGKQLHEKFRIGMTDVEISSVIDELKRSQKQSSSGYDTVGAPCIRYKYLCGDRPDTYLLMLFGGDQYPHDVLRDVTNETPYRYIQYKYNAVLYLFFDEKTKLLRGWVNSEKAYSWISFRHERLTSKLTLSSDFRDRMTRSDVHALIGPPTFTIAAPSKITRAHVEDHFWIPSLPPALGDGEVWEVYEYQIESGATRRVYTAYSRKANYRLEGFGYDHAHEESERYLRASKVGLAGQ